MGRAWWWLRTRMFVTIQTGRRRQRQRGLFRDGIRRGVSPFLAEEKPERTLVAASRENVLEGRAPLKVHPRREIRASRRRPAGGRLSFGLRVCQVMLRCLLNLPSHARKDQKGVSLSPLSSLSFPLALLGECEFYREQLFFIVHSQSNEGFEGHSPSLLSFSLSISRSFMCIITTVCTRSTVGERSLVCHDEPNASPSSPLAF